MINITCHTQTSSTTHSFVDMPAARYALEHILQQAYELKNAPHYKRVRLFPYTPKTLVDNLNIAMFNLSPDNVDTKYTLD